MPNFVEIERKYPHSLCFIREGDTSTKEYFRSTHAASFHSQKIYNEIEQLYQSAN